MNITADIDWFFSNSIAAFAATLATPATPDPNAPDHHYWDGWYGSDRTPTHASTFAEFCCPYLTPGGRLIDLGCGNGRDTDYFGNLGFSVLGVDYSQVAIRNNQRRNRRPNVNFAVADFTSMTDLGQFDTIYSRFSLHAVDAPTEQRLLSWCVQHLNPGGRFCVEARSTNDPLLTRGQRLSPTENYLDHYRRFLDYPQFTRQIADLGLRILFQIEAADLSPWGDDNPVVIRLIAAQP